MITRQRDSEIFNPKKHLDLTDLGRLVASLTGTAVTIWCREESWVVSVAASGQGGASVILDSTGETPVAGVALPRRTRFILPMRGVETTDAYDDPASSVETAQGAVMVTGKTEADPFPNERAKTDVLFGKTQSAHKCHKIRLAGDKSIVKIRRYIDARKVQPSTTLKCFCPRTHSFGANQTIAICMSALVRIYDV